MKKSQNDTMPYTIIRDEAPSCFAGVYCWLLAYFNTTTIWRCLHLFGDHHEIITPMKTKQVGEVD